MRKVVFVGRPNSGKSTLLNEITGKDLKVGNWHGVTVEPTEIAFVKKGERATLVDLPGFYSLSFAEAEEKVTAEYLKRGNYDAIVLVADAEKLSSVTSLYLELSSLGKPITLFVNFYGDFCRKGGRIDEGKARKFFNCDMIFGDAYKRRDAKKLEDFIFGKKDFVPSDIPSEPENGLAFFPSGKRDGVILKSAFYYATFVLSSVFIFWFAFGKYGAGDLISGAIGRLTRFFCEKTEEVLSPFCSPFLLGAISACLSGVGIVAEFLPQIAIMSVGLDILDQSGFISMLAVVTDGVLTKFGLNGKAVYSLLGGFGCSAVAFASAQGIDDPPVRARTALCLPFITCSAKTPVYALVGKIVFGIYSPFIIAGFFVLSFFFTGLFASLFYKLDEKPPSPLIIELATLKIPKFKTLFLNLKRTLKNFAVRLTTTVLISSLTLYLLSSLTPSFSLANSSGEDSILSYIGRGISFAFVPMGITDWRYAVSVVVGFFAKEGIVSSLCSLFQTGITLSISEALPFLCFIYAYTPCVSALSAQVKVAGRKQATFSGVFQLLFAFLFAYSVRFLFLILAKTTGIVL